MSNDEQTASFDRDIKPLFRERDRESMKWLLDLWSYEDVRSNAPRILDVLRKGSMPCDGAWRPEQVDLFEGWTRSGMNA